MPPLRPLRSSLPGCAGSDSAHIFGLSGGFAMVLSPAVRGCGVGLHWRCGGSAPVLPRSRGIRQILIGFGAAFVTYLLGLAFGTTVG